MKLVKLMFLTTTMAAVVSGLTVPQTKTALEAALNKKEIPEKCTVIFDADGWFCQGKLVVDLMTPETQARRSTP